MKQQLKNASFPWQGLISIIVLFVCIVLITISITEFTSRDDLAIYLDGRIKDEITFLSTTPLKDSTSLLFLVKQQDKLELLVMLGKGQSGETVGEIRQLITSTIDKDTSSLKTFSPLWEPILKFSSEQLMAFTTIICGLIGAIISSMVAQRNIEITRIGIGVSAAFVSYILIKSGKFIFLVSNVKDVNPLNPYTLALLGLIAGLYSDKFFKFLQERVMNAVEKTISTKDSGLDSGK